MTTQETQRDESGIRTLIERWAEAVRAQNIPGIVAHHSPDMLMFDVPPPTQLRGIDAYQQSWKPFFASSTQPIAFDLSELVVHAGADIAFATALVHCAGHDARGQAFDLDVRLTVGLRKTADGWTVVHEHHSAPAE